MLRSSGWGSAPESASAVIYVRDSDSDSDSDSGRDSIGDDRRAAHAPPAARAARSASPLSADLRAVQDRLHLWDRNWESLAALHERGRRPLSQELAQWCRQQAEHAMYCVRDVETGSDVEAERYLRRAPEIQQGLNRLCTIDTPATPVLEVFLRNRRPVHRALMSLALQKAPIQYNVQAFARLRWLADRADSAESADDGMMALNEVGHVLRLMPIGADGPFWRAEEILQKLVATFVRGVDHPPVPPLLRTAPSSLPVSLSGSLPDPLRRSTALPPSSPTHPASGGPLQPGHR